MFFLLFNRCDYKFVCSLIKDYTRSPKDRRPVNKESGYPTNHDRNNSDVSCFFVFFVNSIEHEYE